MQVRKQFLVAALVLLVFMFTGSFALAQVYGNLNEINTTINDDVSGNTGGPNKITALGDSNLPLSADSRNVYENQVVIQNNGEVTGTTYGGLTYGAGSVTYNEVTIESGGQASGAVYGGRIYSTTSFSDVANNKRV